MIADFLFGLSLIFIMIILLAAVMSICPKWGFALASKEVKEAMKDYPAPVKGRNLDRFQVFRREQIVRLLSFPFICALLSGIFFIGK